MRSAGTAARPSGSTLHGSMSRSAVESTAGSSTSAWTQPSSCSQRRCSGPVRRARGGARRCANGRSSELGELGTDLAGVGVDRVAARRARGRTAPRAVTSAASARAVASVSEPANAGSVTSTPVDLDAAVGAPRDRLAQRVLGRGRTEREDADRAAVLCASSTACATARRQ